MNTKRAPLPQSSAMTLRDIYYVIFRHKKKVAIFFCCVLALVVFTIVRMPRVYESEAQMLIRLGRENTTLDPTTGMGAPTINVTESRETEINTDIEVLRGREIVERVVDSLGVGTILNLTARTEKKHLQTSGDSVMKKEQAVALIEKNLTTELIKKTNIINISYQSLNPQTAHDVLDMLIRCYYQKHMSIYRPAGSYAYIEQQKDFLEQSLKSQEVQLRTMRDSTGIVSVPEQQASLLTSIADLQSSLERAKADVSASNARIQAIEKNISNYRENMSEYKMVGTNMSSSDLLRTKLNDMRLKQLELGSFYSDSSRKMKNLRQEIQKTQVMLDSEDVHNNGSVVIRQMLLDLMAEKASFAGVNARYQTLKTLMQKALNKMTAFNSNRIIISELQRQLDLDDANYRKYVDNLEQARIDLGLKDKNLSNINIIQPATYPLKSIIGSRKIRVVLFGLLFAFFGSLCVAFVMEFLDHTIKRVEDIEEYLHLPCLGGVPCYVKKDEQLRIPFPNLHVFDTIREKIILAGKDGKIPQILAVTSCYDGEGSGAIASFLAKSLITRPESGRVLLVDLDINNPFLHKVFSLPLLPGFSESFTSEVSGCVTPLQVTTIPGLDVLPAGNANHKTLYLGKSERFSDLVAQWKNAYDYIVLAMPSISRSSLVMELANKVDDVILVVEAERSRREAIAHLLSELLHSGITVFGAVLNKQRYYVPQWLYKRL